MIKKLVWFFMSIVGCKYISNGRNNKLIKNGICKFDRTKIVVNGDNNRIVFGDNCKIKGLSVLILGDNNLLEFGDGVVINASKIQPTVINVVGGKSIKVGSGSLFSNNIEIHTSDYHKIYDVKGNRINDDKDIIIGKNVWVGLGVKILKGTEIADGVVVGAGSVLAGKYKNKNAIICGNPAKIIKENIFWKRG